jgi:hypothetical protein
MTRLPEGIVECNVDQGGEKGVAHVARCASELGEGMVGGRARGEMALADGQGHKCQKPLIVLGQVAHDIGQEFEGVGVRGSKMGRDGEMERPGSGK